MKTNKISKWRLKNKKKLNEQSLAWNKAHPEECKESQKKYRLKNKEKRKQQYKEWYKANLHKQAEYRERYREKRKLQYKNWCEQHPDKVNAYCYKRVADKLKRTPDWLTKEQLNNIIEFYSLAKELSKATGIEHQVDHIVPLRGKNVSGLHVPWNLQVITRSENAKKSNKL